MHDAVIVHYDEIGLKGDNRPFFEKRLVENIRTALKGLKYKDVRRPHGRIVIQLQKSDASKVKSRLERVFGINHFCFAHEAVSDLDDIIKTTMKNLKARKFSTFAVRAKRADKRFEHTSNEINSKVGAAVVKELKKKVDLTKPDTTVYIEVLEKQSFIYFDKHAGPGGLPVGVSGKGICLLSGGIDSPVAAYKMLSRGLDLDYVHFHSYPITKKQSIMKVKKIFKLLTMYQPRARLYLIPFADIQKHIVSETLESYRVILYRRMMLRVAEEMAKKTGAKAIVTGESLAQVASQTMANMTSIQDAVNMIIMRPLLGASKKEIIKTGEEMGT
ncbi:MAG: tRNA 4-thiouridine(8) synthase ThiI, partial [Nanoarchaeota archaeon]|nr:tRNA 4-thiouridine(8) synthase ThiI [Nanoarchaeota archaeon]